MTSGLKPYPSYKDSGVAWLARVPEHWTIGRAKALFRSLDVRSQTGEEELLTVSSKRGVVPRSAARVTMFKAESYIGYKLCWPGDLVINSLWAWGGGLGVSRYHGIVSTAYGVYRPRPRYGDCAAYFHEFVRSTSFNWELRVRSRGIWISRLQLTDDSFLSAPLPIPPPAEQAAIVRFLEHVDRRIRRYIRAKERLIELLEEQKQAIINQAVTGQIDIRTGRAYLSYKRSRVGALGKVPNHWEVTRIKTLCSMKSGTAIDSLSINKEGQYRVFGGNGLRGYTAHYTHDGAFVLIGRQGALCGNIHIVQGRFWASEHAVVVSIQGDHVVDWLGAGLSTMNLNQYSIAAAQPGLAVERILSLPIAVPPRNEQALIAAWTKDRVDRIDSSIAPLKSQIELLREYRTRLVADVVTGKVDVREAAAQPPDADPVEIDGGIEDARSTDDRADLDVPGIQPSGLRT